MSKHKDSVVRDGDNSGGNSGGDGDPNSGDSSTAVQPKCPDCGADIDSVAGGGYCSGCGHSLPSGTDG